MKSVDKHGETSIIFSRFLCILRLQIAPDAVDHPSLNSRSKLNKGLTEGWDVPQWKVGSISMNYLDLPKWKNQNRIPTWLTMVDD